MEKKVLLVTGTGKSLGLVYQKDEREHRKTCDGVYLREESLYNGKYWFSRKTGPSGPEMWPGCLYFDPDYEGWKLNFENKKSAWCFSQRPDDRSSLFPPLGKWDQYLSVGNDHPLDIDYSEIILEFDEGSRVKPARRIY